MRKMIKQICLSLTIVTLVLLLRALPDPLIVWIDEHFNFVGVISTIAWIVYCACDNHDN